MKTLTNETKTALILFAMLSVLVTAFWLTPMRAHAAPTQADKTKLLDVFSRNNTYASYMEMILFLNNAFLAQPANVTNPSTGGTSSSQPTQGTSSGGSVASLCGYAGQITKNLDGGDTDSQILILQKLLNTVALSDSSYQPIAASGDGSYGQETTYMGTLTQAALIRWQKRNMITNAYLQGSVDFNTRARLKAVYCGGTSSSSTAETPGIQSLKSFYGGTIYQYHIDVDNYSIVAHPTLTSLKVLTLEGTSRNTSRLEVVISAAGVTKTCDIGVDGGSTWTNPKKWRCDISLPRTYSGEVTTTFSVTPSDGSGKKLAGNWNITVQSYQGHTSPYSVGETPANPVEVTSPSTSPVTTNVDTTKSDLIASVVTPSSGSGSSAFYLYSIISNAGIESTGKVSVTTFERASSATGAGATIIGYDADGGTILSPGQSYSLRHLVDPGTFPGAGTYYVRACADYSVSGGGLITEANESNNCSIWTAFTVN